MNIKVLVFFFKLLLNSKEQNLAKSLNKEIEKDNMRL